MADVMRYRYGNAKPVVSKAVASEVVIEIGDLVFDNSGDVEPAADFTWNTDIGTTQADFAPVFLGVASQRSRDGDTDPIRVGTAGVWEFDCAAATFELGALVGPAKQTGNALESQKVVAVATKELAIGKVAQRYGSNTTKVKVEIFSAVMAGGVPMHPAEILEAIDDAVNE